MSMPPNALGFGLIMKYLFTIFLCGFVGNNAGHAHSF